jgi:hypothetical protein
MWEFVHDIPSGKQAQLAFVYYRAIELGESRCRIEA